MKLYHTGKMIIRDPDLTRGRKNADFGQGFYLTPDMEFAYRWAGTDAVIGPIANDTIFETFGILSSGFLKAEDALKLLMIGPEYTQAAIKTERALKQLNWKGAEKITRLDEGRRRAEQDAYQTALAEAFQEIAGKE